MVASSIILSIDQVAFIDTLRFHKINKENQGKERSHNFDNLLNSCKLEVIANYIICFLRNL